MDFLNKEFLFFSSFLFVVMTLNAQSKGVHLDKEKVDLKFENIADLIVLKADLNDFKDLNFIVDTGSNVTIVFDSIYFTPKKYENAHNISIRGLGSDTLLSAKVVTENRFSLHRLFYDNDARIVVVGNNKFDLGAKFGKDIHGIIGNDFFRDFAMHIQYSKEKITVAQSVQKKSRYQVTNLPFYRNKPFLKLQDASKKEYELLIDSGGSDAVWFFDTEVNWEEVPHIRDFLGFGLSGEVIGNRVRKDSMRFASFWFPKLYVAIPDANYTNFVKEMYPNRKGSVGGKFLKRFDWVIDYPNQKLYFRKNRNFRKSFTYNATGIEVFQPLEFIHYYVIESVLRGSAGDEAGLYPDDIIKSINGVAVYELSLKEIYDVLNNYKAKKMTIAVERNGRSYKFQIPIRDILNEE